MITTHAMFSLTFRLGNPSVWGQPVYDLHVRLGRHYYVRHFTRRPGALSIVLPGIVFSATRVL